MPDFSNCVKDDNGDIWCYDEETGDVCQIIVNRPTPSMIPQKVLLKLLQNKKKD